MASDDSKPLAFEQIEKVQIDADKLQEGMFVCELDRPWTESPFVFQGFMLTSQKDVMRVRECCEWVYIDVKKSVRFKPGQPGNPVTPTSGEKPLFKPSFSAIAVDSPETPGKQHGFLGKVSQILKKGAASHRDKDFPLALKSSVETRVHTNKLVKSIMGEIRLGKSIDTPAAKEAVAACVDNVMMNQDAGLLLTRLRNKDEYTSEHSLNVAIISIAFGRHLGMNRKELNVVGLCGLLHDMGKMLTPLDILNKPGRLNDEEMEIMKRHPADGREILLDTREVMDTVIDTAFGHHERLNGKGYPRGIGGSEIPLYTRIVSIADVYDAITGDRIYRQGETAETALGILHRSAGNAFDESLVIKFIQTIGTYPLGTVVEMTNGEVGIVVDNNPRQRLRPKIKLLLGHDKQPCKPKIINLNTNPADSIGEPYAIKVSHRAGSFDIDLSQHIQSYIKRI
ncbi:HD-GYP domain-containing protein [Thiolapillus brandeum]|uniref:Metal-dependent phosphohydrolase n=1 Tax=Thiolapillus brandeum TaxID=1076588 RepID=A0A7U6GJL7_9GAMM|nr:HD-GYP domain-containing protein [Thiolapillus brandeum]BAO44789.1 metal-dependent phosphohydrolase [Thiolapillus brandeum]